MKCSCGVVFLTTVGHTACWECRHLGGAPNRRPMPTNRGPFDLRDWFGLAGIGTTG